MLYKLKKEIENLNKTDLNSLIVELLIEEKIKYTEISNLYVYSLEKKEKDLRVNISGLASMLSYFVPFNRRKKDKKFIEGKSAYHILKSKVFKTAPIEKEYKEILKKTSYKEDEFGLPLN
jgi:hypothetical protein